METGGGDGGPHGGRDGQVVTQMWNQRADSAYGPVMGLQTAGLSRAPSRRDLRYAHACECTRGSRRTSTGLSYLAVLGLRRDHAVTMREHAWGKPLSRKARHLTMG